MGASLTHSSVTHHTLSQGIMGEKKASPPHSTHRHTLTEIHTGESLLVKILTGDQFPWQQLPSYIHTFIVFFSTLCHMRERAWMTINSWMKEVNEQMNGWQRMSQLGFHFTRAGNRQRVFMHLLLYSEGFFILLSQQTVWASTCKSDAVRLVCSGAVIYLHWLL